MRGKVIQILKDYDPGTKTDIKVEGRHCKTVLMGLKAGEEYLLNDLVKKYQKILGHDNIVNTRGVFKNVMRKGKAMGIIKEVQVESITFSDFCNLKSVKRMRSQLKETQVTHEESRTKHSARGTRRGYSVYCWHFNTWINGKTITTKIPVQITEDTQRITEVTTELNSIEDLLEIRKKTSADNPDIAAFIVDYLSDDVHKNLSVGSMKNQCYAIDSYFNNNHYTVLYSFNSHADHMTTKKVLKGDVFKLELEDLFKMMTVGRPNIVQKAAVLCKFHGGLDNITMTDDFNYSFGAFAKAFGTADYENWDTKKCPVLIKLCRIKTEYVYYSMYDVDAIKSLQEALKWRKEVTGKEIKVGDAMLLNRMLKPITDRWLSDLIPLLAERSGVQRIVKVLRYYAKEKKSHELRDLLKSTMIDCGTAYWAADHAIGHTPKDSYDKQAELYTVNLRKQYVKSSKRINIFTNISQYISPIEERDELAKRVDDIEKNNAIDIERQEIVNKNKNKLFELFRDPEIMALLKKKGLNI